MTSCMFEVTFDVELILKVLVRSLQDDLGEDPGCWATLSPPCISNSYGLH